jgi:hypothetical protein
VGKLASGVVDLALGGKGKNDGKHDAKKEKRETKAVQAGAPWVILSILSYQNQRDRASGPELRRVELRIFRALPATGGVMVKRAKNLVKPPARPIFG